MMIYVDGQLLRTVAVTNLLVYGSGFESSWLPAIGGSPGIGYPYDSFAGSIDDVRIYNRALSSQEVNDLFTLESPPPVPSLSIFTAIELDLSTVNGQNYQIQASPDLLTWTNFDNPIAGDGNHWSKTYSTRGSPILFYRFVIVP
jgi:hypothetical protein